MRTILITLFALLLCATCVGQSSFQEITPGKSTRANVTTALGQPVLEVSKTLSEYAPPPGVEKVYVQYREQSSVVERIEVLLLKPILRSAMISRFNLPDQAFAQQIKKGKRVEYFGGSALIVLTYASTETSSGVSRVGYYSRELYDAEVERVKEANLPRSPQPQDRDTTTDSSSPERPGAAQSTARGSRSSTALIGTSSSETKRTKDSSTTRSSDGSLSITVTARADGIEVQPSTRPGTIGNNNAGFSEAEIFLSAPGVAQIRWYIPLQSAHWVEAGGG